MVGGLPGVIDIVVRYGLKLQVPCYGYYVTLPRLDADMNITTGSFIYECLKDYD